MVKYISPIITICSLFFSNQNLGQKNVVFENILGKLAIYNNTSDFEKTYITTDKDFYINGETIWYKVFLLNGFSLTATDESNVIYTELVNSKDSVLVRQKLFNQGLGAQGSIELPEKIEKGDYRLIAYTKYMLNESSPLPYIKKITIQIPKSKEINHDIAHKEIFKKKQNKKSQIIPIISFFPEGGSIVSGIPCVLGIKAADRNGNGIALRGKIFDEEDNLITVFESHEFGLGKTTFIPEFNKKYYAKVIVNGKIETYPLPNSKQKGYVLGVQNFGEFLRLKVLTNTISGLKGTILVGHINGRTIFKHQEKTADSSYSIKLLTKKIEDGVAHFTLFTAEGEPVCERLVFVDNMDNDVVLTANLDSENYGPREKVSFELGIRNSQGRTLKGNLSASVITSTNTSGYNGDGIKSWLLLNSDLGGTVPNADFFFEKNDMKRKYLLDALMLTHGWRRFVWKDLLNDEVSKAQKFVPEKGIMVEGKITSFSNEYKPEEALVSLSIIDKDLFQTEKSTDVQGKFSFGPFTFQDSLKVLLQAKPIDKSKKGKNSDLAIYVENSFPKHSLELKTESKNVTKKLIFPEKYIEQAYKRKIEEFKYDPKVTLLEGVTVKSKKKKTREQLVNDEIQKFTLHGEPDTRLFTDSISGAKAFSAFDLLLHAVGVQVVGTFPFQNVIIRGGNTSLLGSSAPLLLIDGMPTDPQFIGGMMANEIMFVDVLKGSSAAIYGLRGGNGVIAFYTHKPLDIEGQVQKRYPGIVNYKANGFTKVREFYSPNYSVPKPEHNKMDYRTTLHWEPNITITDAESANFSFFTGDLPGKYLIKVEGITMDGRPVSTIKSFSVQER
ncbi:Plug domain-containing protein [Croceitalea sp. MTPC9]|uniref:TonB-dependent receptor plug domain-containing protein n=1 Tax=unclassified Croceitalea TaxID=2632280 RepID=UPI002B3EE43C|nr:Plug domain-containing protein [Croceitalea sp. MTPC6]GMN16534.1 Plug domain-containing protein [Croceitalea sp. MTPC9]